MQVPHFKIRCSKIGEIMGEVNRPTEKQLKLLADLQAKEKRTDKQEETLKELIAKRDAKPSLSVGAKTYCKKWLKQQIGFYNRVPEFSNKYTERGIICEPQAIELLSEAMGYGLISKNETRFTHDPDIEGTPDVIVAKSVDDVKASWNWETFPLFEDVCPESDYIYQGHGYMVLADKPAASVNYCLIDTPDEFIEREARIVSFKAGYDEVDMDLYEEVRAKMTYSNLPLSLRFKRYEVQRDEAVIASIRSQVALCRIYITELFEAYQKSTNGKPSLILATPITPQLTMVEAIQ